MKKKQKPYFRNLLKLIHLTFNEDRFLLIAYLFTSLLGAALLFAVYYVYKLMIDQVTRAVAISTTTSFFIVITTYLFFEYLSRFVNYTFNLFYFDYFVRTKLQNLLTRKFMAKLGEMDFVHLEDGNVRNLIAKIENTYSTRLPDIIHTINNIVFNVAALIFSFIIALRFNPIYFVVLGLVSAPVYYLRTKYGNIAWNRYTANANNTNNLLYLRSLFTNFQILSEMKIYGLSNYFIEKTKNFQEKILKDYERPMKVYTILSTVSFILIPIAIYFALTNFIIDVTKHKFTIGDFTFFLNTLFSFSSQISGILLNLGLITENSLFLNDYFDFMKIKNTIKSPPNPYFFSNVATRKIEYKNVWFKYPGNKEFSLKNINITINKGENVAIVGSNGAGKSTFVKLLLRFYDPTRGRILIDGIDLKRLDIGQWYQHIGILFQDFARFFATLRENIIYGDLQKQPDTSAETALKKAQGTEALRVLPRKYNQILGRWFEQGVELSGGQWQKVAIARAIYRDAPILIMDEPTSNIDAEAEHKIFENLNELYKEKTLIFISHRFSTVRRANKIYVLRKGELAEKGTHEELMGEKGLYFRFFNLQRRGYE